MQQTLCPICETTVLRNADFCPECGWEIDRTAGELIISDPRELQQQASRKQQKFKNYRQLYQRITQVEQLERQNESLQQQVGKLEAELEKARESFQSTNQEYQNKLKNELQTHQLKAQTKQIYSFQLQIQDLHKCLKQSESRLDSWRSLLGVTILSYIITAISGIALFSFAHLWEGVGIGLVIGLGLTGVFIFLIEDKFQESTVLITSTLAMFSSWIVGALIDQFEADYGWCETIMKTFRWLFD